MYSTVQYSTAKYMYMYNEVHCIVHVQQYSTVYICIYTAIQYCIYMYMYVYNVCICSTCTILHSRVLYSTCTVQQRNYYNHTHLDQA